jgi:hypothetical protein
MLERRPGFAERPPRALIHENRQTVLVGYAVFASHGSSLFGLPELLCQNLARNPYAYDDLSRTVSGSPDKVTVVAADRVRKTLWETEEISSPRLAVVTGQDAGFGPLVCGEAMVNTTNRRRHLLPTETVGEVLGQLRYFTRLDLHSRIITGGARDPC